MKRITNAELEAFIEGVSGRFISIGGKAALAILNELKERRAADLTSTGREWLVDLRGRVNANYDGTHADRQKDHLAILDRLIEGEKP